MPTTRSWRMPERAPLPAAVVLGVVLAVVLLQAATTHFVDEGMFVVVLPALGIAAGAVVRGPRALALAAAAALVLSSFGFSLLDGGTAADGVVVAVGSLLCVAVVVAVARLGGLERIGRPREVLVLALAAALSGLFAGVLAAAESVLTADLPYVDGPPVWLQALVGIGLAVAIGVLVSAPAVLEAPGTVRTALGGHTWEGVAVVLLTIGMLVLLVVRPNADWLSHTGAAFALLPFLVWGALRFGPGFTSGLLTVVAVAVAWSIAEDRGVFAPESAPLGVVSLGAQVFLLASALGALLLSVYAEHLRRQEAQGLATSLLLERAVEGMDAHLFVKRYDAATDRFVYVEANHGYARSLGYEPEEVIGRSDAELLDDPEEVARFRAQDEEVLRSGAKHVYDGETEVGGRHSFYSALRFPVVDDVGAVTAVGAVCIDRTQERRREDLLGQMFSRSPVPTARLRLEQGRATDVLEANAALGALLGLPPEELVGGPLTPFLQPGVALPLPRSDTDHLLAPARHELRLRRADGEEATALVSLGVVHGGPADEHYALLILEDVTARRIAEANLLHRASHDPLTDLLNRQAAAERIAEALVRLRRRPSTLAVLCCDVDGFKYLNESFGHEAGDQTLREVANRLLGSARPGDVVARLGADEFVVVCEGLSEPADALVVAERLRAAVARPIEQGGQTYGVTLSVGLTVTDDGRRSPTELLREADTALSRGQEDGPDHVSSYHADLGRRAALRVAARERIRRGLAEDRVEIHLQPVVDLPTGRIVGAEALVRLRDDDGTLLGPASFIDVAEDSGLIVPLGERVLDLSLGQLASWRAAGHDVGVSVNVSPRQLALVDFPRVVSDVLAVHRVPAAAVTLEVTESAVVDPGGPVLATLRRLRELGVHVSIDDFGTGYSSLTSLRHLPADEVKIDRSFVSGLGRGVEDDAIVRAVITMAHDTGRLVVGEGVESEHQLLRLAALGCDRVQGFLLARPVAAADLDPATRYDTGGGGPALRLARGTG